MKVKSSFEISQQFITGIVPFFNSVITIILFSSFSCYS